MYTVSCVLKKSKNHLSCKNYLIYWKIIKQNGYDCADSADWSSHYTPLQNGVLVGYTIFSMSVIPSFRQHLKILLCNFDRFCPILFRCTPHHNHQTMHVWQKNWGWRISITRVMPLCNSYNKMFVLWLIVHTLWNQPLRAFTGSFQHLANMLKTYIEDVHEEVWCWKNIFWQPYGVFNLAIFRRLHLVNYCL